MAFSVAFQPLYFLMLLMYFDQLKREENTLARGLDMAIIVLGIVFMVIQGSMCVRVHYLGDVRVQLKHAYCGGGTAREVRAALKQSFYTGLVVWFLLEVVLSYWWCYVTGADPLTEHTPFVLLFLVFNGAQYYALVRLGVLETLDFDY